MTIKSWTQDTTPPLEGPNHPQHDEERSDRTGLITAAPESFRLTPLHHHKYSQTGLGSQPNGMPAFNQSVQPPSLPIAQHSHDSTPFLFDQKVHSSQIPPSPWKNEASVEYRQGHHSVHALGLHSMSRTQTRPDTMTKSASLSSSGGSGSGIGISGSSDEFCYILRMRQQPVAARLCGFGDKDRRMIDPPPIVQLFVQGPNLTEMEIVEHLRYPHYVMSCSIRDEFGSRDASFMPETYLQQRRLIGRLVSTPFVGKDENDEEGCFFCFPDLSCRTTGRFRLSFSLVKVDPIRAKEVKRLPTLVEVQTDILTVYSAQDFPGIQGSTKLTKRLREQGCMIPIKKSNDRIENTSGAIHSANGWKMLE